MQVKTIYPTEKWGFATCGFQKISRHTHQNSLKPSQFQNHTIPNDKIAAATGHHSEQS